MTTPKDLDAIREAMAKHRDRTRPAQGLEEVAREAADKVTQRWKRYMRVAIAMAFILWLLLAVWMGGRP